MADRVINIIDLSNDPFTQNTDLIADQTPKAGASRLRIVVAFSTSGKLYFRTVDGGTEVNLALNSDTALNADALYELKFDITDDVNYNLQYSGATGTLRRLIVNELSFN